LTEFASRSLTLFSNSFIRRSVSSKSLTFAVPSFADDVDQGVEPAIRVRLRLGQAGERRLCTRLSVFCTRLSVNQGGVSLTPLVSFTPSGADSQCQDSLKAGDALVSAGHAVVHAIHSFFRLLLADGYVCNEARHDLEFSIKLFVRHAPPPSRP
jgi:hypothetical protein